MTASRQAMSAGARGASRGSRWTTVDVTLGGGHEGGRRHIEGPPRLAEPLRDHREPAVGAGAGRRDDALRDLLLEHERHGGDRIDVPQPADQERGGDVVGQVGDDRDPAGPDKRGDVEIQRIAGDHVEPICVAPRKVGERVDAPRIAFDPR